MPNHRIVRSRTVPAGDPVPGPTEARLLLPRPVTKPRYHRAFTWHSAPISEHKMTKRVAQTVIYRSMVGIGAQQGTTARQPHAFASLEEVSSASPDVVDASNHVANGYGSLVLCRHDLFLDPFRMACRLTNFPGVPMKVSMEGWLNSLGPRARQ
jgi:hypothetical protein